MFYQNDLTMADLGLFFAGVLEGIKFMRLLVAICLAYLYKVQKIRFLN